MVAKEKTPYLIFAIDDKKLAIELELIEQVYSAVEVTPLVGAPDSILGLINVHGAIIVVLNVRKKLGLRERSIELSDQILIANLDDRQLALLVDEVVEVLHAPSHKAANGSKTSDEKPIIQNEDETIELYELQNFLSEAEEDALKTALQLAYTH
ncbi:MAG: chemotaxis protein CheW [Cyanobacteria bacterium SZAS-4]|nr:chemotaxis protein CheW [Cyanobacteria bacterium SZAS-4]